MSNANNKKKKTVRSEDRLVGLRKHSEEINKLVVESLQGALLQLIGRVAYERITVTELCKKAGVSRMAFYGNFTCKDDIFKRIVSDLQTEMLARIGSPFRQTLTQSWYVSLFEYVQEKSNVLQPIFSAGYQDKYLEMVNSIVLRHKDMQPNETYLRLLWSGGIVNSVVYWLLNGMAETPKQMAEYCQRCFANFNQRNFIGDLL